MLSHGMCVNEKKQLASKCKSCALTFFYTWGICEFTLTLLTLVMTNVVQFLTLG